HWAVRDPRGGGLPVRHAQQGHWHRRAGGDPHGRRDRQRGVQRDRRARRRAADHARPRPAGPWPRPGRKRMKAFEYVNARDLKHASSLLGPDFNSAKVLAGGVDLLGEMKEHLIEPERLVNLKSISSLKYIRAGRSGLQLGALAVLSDIADHREIRERYTVLAEAAEAVGSPQIRNVGTIGGNL